MVFNVLCFLKAWLEDSVISWVFLGGRCGSLRVT